MTHTQTIAAAFTAGWITALAAAAWIIHKTQRPKPNPAKHQSKNDARHTHHDD